MKESVEARIGRYLAGEMDGQERAGFEQELAQDPVLKETLMPLQRIWQHSESVDQGQWDVSAALERFAANHEGSPVESPSRRYAMVWAIAASLLLLLGSAWFLWFKPSTITYLYADVKDTPVRLPDGSKVYLNKGSAVTVHPFTRKSRPVELSGEAYFEVSPDPGKPFIITCGLTTTEVVGTSFNLAQGPDQVTLFVNSGKVIFRAKENTKEALALTAGESALYADHSLTMIPNPSPNTHAWHTRQLQFVNTPLPDVLRDVQHYFGLPVRVDNDAILSCRISIHRPLKDPQMSGVLDIITRPINATWEKQGDTYVIKGGSCQ